MPPQPTVALFVTCLVDQIYPHIGVATLRLLRRAGYHVDFPLGQTCCGQPFANSGYQPQAIQLAHHTITTLEPYPAVVLPSGSCTTMLRHHYPQLLAADSAWHDRAQALAAKTFELTEFLTTRSALPAVTSPHTTPVTYHDSCHMCRTLRLRQPPRTTLHHINAPLHEHPESDRCCGFGGLFSTKMPDVAAAMTHAKQNAIPHPNNQPATLVTADPGCLLQFQRHTPPDQPQPRHIAELLEEATR
ncbi:MAG TPA: (Fe-S)-binding protein [Anaerolineae bacterium]|nr:(Fe-S)-binding protein [Anaerolineae bacterium]